MIVYHGTTLSAARQIRKIGLIPHRETAFNTMRSDNGWKLRDESGNTPMENEPRVYVTRRKDVAEMFAQFRAQYERAKPGEALPWGGLKLIKLGRTQRKANPAIVELDIPEDIQLETDVQADMFDGLTCQCPIPADYVKAVKPLTFTMRNPAAFVSQDYDV
jgi:hypothetical protein